MFAENDFLAAGQRRSPAEQYQCERTAAGGMGRRDLAIPKTQAGHGDD